MGKKVGKIFTGAALIVAGVVCTVCQIHGVGQWLIYSGALMVGGLADSMIYRDEAYKEVKTQVDQEREQIDREAEQAQQEYDNAESELSQAVGETDARFAEGRESHEQNIKKLEDNLEKCRRNQQKIEEKSAEVAAKERKLDEVHEQIKEALTWFEVSTPFEAADAAAKLRNWLDNEASPMTKRIFINFAFPLNPVALAAVQGLAEHVEILLEHGAAVLPILEEDLEKIRALEFVGVLELIEEQHKEEFAKFQRQLQAARRVIRNKDADTKTLETFLSDYQACTHLINRAGLMHEALRHHRSDLVKLFVDKGLEPSMPNARGQTPLSLAIKENDKAFVTALIDTNMPIHRHYLDISGDPAIYAAIHEAYHNQSPSQIGIEIDQDALRNMERSAKALKKANLPPEDYQYEELGGLIQTQLEHAKSPKAVARVGIGDCPHVNSGQAAGDYIGYLADYAFVLNSENYPSALNGQLLFNLSMFVRALTSYKNLEKQFTARNPHVVREEKANCEDLIENYRIFTDYVKQDFAQSGPLSSRIRKRYQEVLAELPQIIKRHKVRVSDDTKLAAPFTDNKDLNESFKKWQQDIDHYYNLMRCYSAVVGMATPGIPSMYSSSQLQTLTLVQQRELLAGKYAMLPNADFAMDVPATVVLRYLDNLLKPGGVVSPLSTASLFSHKPAPKKATNKANNDSKRYSFSSSVFSQPDSRPRRQLAELNLEVEEVKSDGNCLFHSVAVQINRDAPKLYEKLRNECVDYMEGHPNQFKHFFTDEEPYEKHLKKMRKHGTWGGYHEVAALSKQLSRPILIIQDGEKNKTLSRNYLGEPLFLYRTAKRVKGREYAHYEALHPTNGATPREIFAKVLKENVIDLTDKAPTM